MRRRAISVLAALIAVGATGYTFSSYAQSPAGIAVEQQVLPAAGDDPANWRLVESDNLLQLTVRHGSILVELRPDFAPGHVDQIKRIVRNGHYDGLPFHRVIDDFMAQGGEVRAVYPQDASYPQLAPEFEFRRDPGKTSLTRFGERTTSELTGFVDGFVVRSQPETLAPLMADGSVNSWVVHCAGVASMARADAPNSADTQFFLMRQEQTQLDRNYTAWGRVVAGLDVVRSIRPGPDETDGRLAPEEADRLLRAVLLSDVPPGTRPRVYVQRTEGELFRTSLAETETAPSSGVCDRLTPSVVVEDPARD